MQRWRFIRYVTFALVLLGAPAWLNAQEPAKKDAARPHSCRAETQPLRDAAKKAAALVPHGESAAGRRHRPLGRERVQVFRIS